VRSQEYTSSLDNTLENSVQSSSPFSHNKKCSVVYTYDNRYPENSEDANAKFCVGASCIMRSSMEMYEHWSLIMCAIFGSRYESNESDKCCKRLISLMKYLGRIK